MSEMQTGRQAGSLIKRVDQRLPCLVRVRACIRACLCASLADASPASSTTPTPSQLLPPSLPRWLPKRGFSLAFPTPLPSPPLTRLEGQILRQSGDGDEDGDGKEDRRRTHPSCVSSNHSSPSHPSQGGHCTAMVHDKWTREGRGHLPSSRTLIPHLHTNELARNRVPTRMQIAAGMPRPQMWSRKWFTQKNC